MPDYPEEISQRKSKKVSVWGHILDVFSFVVSFNAPNNL